MERAAEHESFSGVTVVDHPLVAARLAALRDQQTDTAAFRENLQELSIMLLVEASRGWPTSSVAIETPIASSAGVILSKHIALVPILRAGVGMLDGMLRLLPEARVGHLGLYRDELTLRPVTYYQRVPTGTAAAHVLLLDPMLATGFSACEAASILKKNGARDIQFVCVVACPEGITQFQSQHRDVPIITAAIDPELNEFGYIVPGLGDAGDRYYGTT